MKGNGVVFSIFALSHIDASGSRPKRGLCVTTLVTRNEGGHSTANPLNRQSFSLIHKLHLLTYNDTNVKSSRLRDKSDLTQYLGFDAY
ncbi:protein of unknown function [Enterobacter cancerogenus]|nr:protein of unknown function [Enterobacter cancerogenus]